MVWVPPDRRQQKRPVRFARAVWCRCGERSARLTRAYVSSHGPPGESRNKRSRNKTRGRCSSRKQDGAQSAVSQEARGCAGALCAGALSNGLRGNCFPRPLRTSTPAHQRTRAKKKTPGHVSLGSLRASDGDLRTVIQVRGVAAQLRSTAERELAERSEALNSRLLVLHLLPPPKQGTWVYTKWCLRRPAGPSTCELPFLCLETQCWRASRAPEAALQLVRCAKYETRPCRCATLMRFRHHCTYRSTSNRK